MTNVVFDGYHGASLHSARSIARSQNLHPSIGAHHWYGDGRYFFIDGVSDPLDNASKWANAEAWCNRRHRLKYTDYGVIQAEIETQENCIFDLRKDERATIFERFRKVVVSQIENSKKTIADYKDSMVFDLLAIELDISVFIGNQHIQLTPEERRQKVRSNIANVTMMCARESEKVTIRNIALVADGAVDNG